MLTFVGAGVNQTILDGGGIGTVITLEYGYSASFSSLTISGGNAGSGIEGGGILNFGTLSLQTVKVTNNVASDGGGIYSSGALTMINSVVSGNSANANSSSDGGGLFLNTSSPVSLSNITISDNVAQNASGGIHNQSSALLTMTNVTISGNSAPVNGAMTNTGNAVTVVINSTIANNRFPSLTGFGGITNYKTISFKNTIIAGNYGGNCSTSGGSWTSQGHNLDSGHDCGFTQTGDLQDTAPQLGSLAVGSSSWLPMMALLAGSPAIDSGTNSGCPTSDERGIPRPVGTACDIGAFEFATSISGSTSIKGVTLSYNNGGPKTIIANGFGGTYTIFYLPYNWSGTVTPSKLGYTFSPPSITYHNLTADRTAQDYIPIVTFLTITGNAGDAGVVLSYTDGTPKTVTSSSNGRYTITIPYGWSGLVTPSKTGITFSPPNRPYTNVIANQAAQNYLDTVTFKTSGTSDGWILESAKGSGVGGSNNSTATTFQLGDDASNRQYRAILSFNTASLPDTATVTAAVLKIKQSGGVAGTNPFNILGSLYADIKKGYFGSNSALQTTDFNASATASKVGKFGSTPASGWYTASLTSTGRADVNKTNLTQFRLYFSKATNANNKADYMKFLSGNSSSNPAQLSITYTLP